MADRICHLRGSESEWESHDGIVKDGELALVMTGEGRYRVKIGNGKKPFSALPFIDGEIALSSEKSCAVTLRTGLDLRAGELSLLSLALPEQIPPELYCTVSFDSGATPTTVEYLFTEADFSGDSLAEGFFIPEAYTHYTLMLWYDGRLQCHVRGVRINE